MVVSQKGTDYLLFPVGAPGEEIERGNDGTLVEKSNVWRSVFLSLFKLKRSANVTLMWTLLLRLVFADGWDIPPLDTKRVRDSVWTQGPMGPEVSSSLHHNQTIKKLLLTRVTSFTPACFVCCAVVNTFSACSFLHRTICAFRHRRL